MAIRRNSRSAVPDSSISKLSLAAAIAVHCPQINSPATSSCVYDPAVRHKSDSVIANFRRVAKSQLLQLHWIVKRGRPNIEVAQTLLGNHDACIPGNADPTVIVVVVGNPLCRTIDRRKEVDLKR